MSQILSIAARKAAAESGKYISAAGAFLLVLAISIGVLPNLSPSVSEQEISAPEPTITSPAEPTEVEVADETPASPSDLAPVADSVIEAETVVMTATVNTITQSKPEPKGDLLTEQELMVATLKPLLGAKTLASLASETEGRIVSSSTGEVSVLNSAGLKANVVYDLNTENGIQSAWFEFQVGDAIFYALPKTWIASKTIDSEGRTVLMLGATDLVVGNADGKLGNVVIENSVLGNGKIRLEIILDDKASPITSSLTIKRDY